MGSAWLLGSTEVLGALCRCGGMQPLFPSAGNSRGRMGRMGEGTWIPQVSHNLGFLPG